MTEGSPLIFISYASPDRDRVTPFAQWLERQGFSVWMDARQLRPGQDWDFEIRRALDKAAFVLSFISSRSFDRRGYIQRELKLALDKRDEKLVDDIYLIPILLDDNVQIPEQVRHLQCIRASDPRCREQIAGALHESRSQSTRSSRGSGAMEPSLQSAARQASAREYERTREWLESRGLPKVARIAQREAYNVLRKYGVIKDSGQSSPTSVGRSHPAQEHQPLSDGEVEELAQACVAMLEVKGQAVEVTLSEMSTAAGGFLLPEDVPRVRQKVNSLIGDPLSGVGVGDQGGDQTI